MWKGKVTPELIELHHEYQKKYDMKPDEYAEIMYDGMNYDEYIGYIRIYLEKKNCEISDMLPPSF